MRDKAGRIAEVIETDSDGKRVHKVVQYDEHYRVKRIVAKAEGTTTPGKPIYPMGEFKRVMKAAHEAAWTAFVAKHAR